MWSETVQILLAGTHKIFLVARKWKESFYFFLRGHGNESCNLIGSLAGQHFPISTHGPR